MQEFKIVPQIFQLETAKEFLENFQIGKNDLVFTSKFIYDKYFVEGRTDISKIEEYHSHNTIRLDVEAMKKLLLRLDFIRKDLKL